MLILFLFHVYLSNVLLILLNRVIVFFKSSILVPRASWGPEHETKEALGTQDLELKS